MNTRSDVNQPLYPPTIHLSDYLAVLKRRKWVVILFFVFLVGTMAVFSFTAQSEYQATAKIIIEPPTVPLLGMTQQRIGRNDEAEDYFQTQYFLLQSREFASQVIKKLDLAAALLPIPAATDSEPGFVEVLISKLLATLPQTKQQYATQVAQQEQPLDETALTSILTNIYLVLDRKAINRVFLVG